MKLRCVTFTTFGLVLVLLVRVDCIVFDAEPEDQTHTFESGSVVQVSLYLDCKLSHLGSNRKVSWFKDGVVVSDGYQLRSDLGHLIDTDRYSIKQHGTLYRFGMAVSDISPSTAAFDSGLYQCAVTRSTNDVVVTDGKSRMAEVAVYVTPSSNYPVCNVIDLSGHELPTSHLIRSARAGETLKMTCQSGPSTPDVSLLWSNGQHGVLQQQFESVSADDTLTSEYVWTALPNHGTVYVFTCILQHPGLHSNRTCQLLLNVEYAPVVTMDRDTDIIMTDSSELVSLTCLQDSNPRFTNVTWYYDSDVIDINDDRFNIRGLSVHISRFRARDNGKHTVMCEVTSSIGTGSVSVALILQIPPPHFTGLPENILSRKVTFATPQSQPTQCQSCRDAGRVINSGVISVGSPQLSVFSWALCTIVTHLYN